MARKKEPSTDTESTITRPTTTSMERPAKAAKASVEKVEAKAKSKATPDAAPAKTVREKSEPVKNKAEKTDSPSKATAKKAPKDVAPATMKASAPDLIPEPPVAAAKSKPKSTLKAKAAEAKSPKATEVAASAETVPTTARPKPGLFGRTRQAPAPVETTPVTTALAPKAEPKPEAKQVHPATQSTSVQSESGAPASTKQLTFERRPKKGSAEDVAAPKETSKPKAKESTKPDKKSRTETTVEVIEEEVLSAPEIRVELGDTAGRLAIIQWRAPGTKRPGQKYADRDEKPRREKDEFDVSDEPTGKNDRKAKGRGRKSDDESTPVQLPEAIVEPPKPEVPQFESLTVPETAAQVVLKDGTPVLVKNHRVYPPLAFFGLVQPNDRLPTVLEEVRFAAEHGVHLFSTLIELVTDEAGVKTALARANELIEKFVEVDPEAQVILRTVFVASRDWEKSYPDSKFKLENGTVAEPSICDDPYWKDVDLALASFVSQLAESKQAAHIMGIHVDRGEWFFAEGSGYDTSIAALDKFRAWLRQRYRNDIVSLRASWYDGGAQFDTVQIPEFGRSLDRSEQFVRMGRKSRRWIDCNLFLSDITVERLFQLCYTVKKASNANFLVGVSYGYTFEWSHPANGHLSLGKLLRCPYLDYVAGPPSYKDREPGGTASFPLPIDSVALNGKMFISEEDFKTSIGGRPEPDEFNPVMKTPQALESVHWRAAGAALAHTAGACWMDSWGNGWLGSRGIWERANVIRDAFVRRLAVPAAAPDVAMLVDERSLALLVDQHAFSALVQNVREALLRSGLSVGFYLLSDLAHRENFPECKLYVFANAWDMRPEVRSAIKARLQRDDKVLFWLYAAGLFEGGRESLERVREVTGIALRPQPFNSRPGTTILNSRDPLCQPLPEAKLKEGGQLEPSYFAIPEEGTVLAEYSQTALPSYVARRFNDEQGTWTSVFLGEPVVTPGLFRALGELAGCHVWSHHDDVVHAVGNYLTVHCGKSGARTLNLPDKWVAYRLDQKDYAPVEMNSHKFIALEGSSHSFIVGPAATVASIVDAKLEDYATIAVSTVREENTIHWDQIQFDVPIMKLDEWVEEAWSEGLSDDLLVKPSLIDVDIDAPGDDADTEEPRSRGRRRQRRRGRGRDDRRDNNSADRQPVGDTGFQVIFRKRE